MPGLREDLVTELIRSLPKQLRRAFVPAPDMARAVLARLGRAARGPARRAGRGTRPPGRRDDPAGRVGSVPAAGPPEAHVPGDGRGPGAGPRARTWTALREQLRPRLQARLADAAGGLTRTGLRDWTIGTLPRVFTHGPGHGLPGAGRRRRRGRRPAVRDRGRGRRGAWRAGTRRLLLLQVPSGAAVHRRPAADQREAGDEPHPYPSVGALLDDCVAVRGRPGHRRTPAARPGMPAASRGWSRRPGPGCRWRWPRRAWTWPRRCWPRPHEAEARLQAAASPALAAAFADMRAQFAALIYPGFVSETGRRRLPDLVRYLRAISRRLDTMAEDPARDAEPDGGRAPGDRGLPGTRWPALPPARRSGADVRAVRWMIEELRVSLFAQVLGTPGAGVREADRHRARPPHRPAQPLALKTAHWPGVVRARSRPGAPRTVAASSRGRPATAASGRGRAGCGRGTSAGRRAAR